MKRIAKLTLFLCLSLLLSQCKKDKTPAAVYKPRFFTNGGSSFQVFDTRDIHNVKGYIYTWNSVSGKYVYNTTNDTSLTPNLKLWPAAITDPVGVGYSYHFLDRTNGNNTYTIEYGLSSVISSTMTADYPAMPSAWKQPNKIEGYANLYELYGASNGASYFFFDFDAGTYLFYRDGGIIADESINNLVTVPKGSLTSVNVDWSKADAVMFDYDETSVSPISNNIFFFDYDAMKYLQINRLDNIAGETGRNTLVTPDWTPMSNLISGWKN